MKPLPQCLAMSVIAGLTLLASCISVPPLENDDLQAYDVAKLSDTHVGHAAVVLNHHEFHTTAYDPRHIVVQMHRSVLVLRSDGKRHAVPRFELRENYDLSDLRVRLLRSGGEIEVIREPKATLDRGWMTVDIGDVEPGTIVEWHATTMTRDAYRTRLERRVRESVPVLDYEVGIHAQKYSGRSKIRASHPDEIQSSRVDLGSGVLTRVRMTDVEPPLHEASAPHSATANRTWSWRQSWYKPNASWAQAGKNLALTVYRDRGWAEGFEMTPSATSCAEGDRGCRLGELMADAASLGPMRSYGHLPDGPITATIDERRLRAFDRAAALFSWLEAETFKVQFAWSSRHETTSFDSRTPDIESVNHVLLYLPKQKGLEAPVWVDAACSWCGPNEVLPSVAGQEAVVIDRKKGKIRSKVRTIKAQARPGPSTQIVTRARLSFDGSATAERVVRTTEGGQTAHAAVDNVGNAAALLRALYPESWATVEVLSETEDPTTGIGEARLAITYGNLLRLESDGPAIDASALMASVWDTKFYNKKRRNDVILESHELAESVELIAPPTSRFLAPPSDVKLEAEGVVATVRYLLSEDSRTLSVERTLRFPSTVIAPAAYSRFREVIRGFEKPDLSFELSLDKTESARYALVWADLTGAEGGARECFPAEATWPDNAALVVSCDEAGAPLSTALEGGESFTKSETCLQARALGLPMVPGPASQTRVLLGDVLRQQACGVLCTQATAWMESHTELHPARDKTLTSACSSGNARVCMHLAQRRRSLPADGPSRSELLKQACDLRHRPACLLVEPQSKLSESDAELVLDELSGIGMCESQSGEWGKVSVSFSVASGAVQNLTVGDEAGEAKSCIEEAIVGAPWPKASNAVELRRDIVLKLE